MSGSSMTFAYDNGPGPLKKVIVDWISDSATGAVSGTTAVKVVGRLVKATTDPAAGGSAPTDNYDITVTDDEGVDVLAACQGTLADRDTANTEEQYFLVKDLAAGTPLAQSIHPAVCSPLGFAVAAAGNSKAGQIILFVEGELLGNI